MDIVFTWKVIVLVVLLVIGGVFAMLPLAMRRCSPKQQPKLLSVSNAFAGGVFLGGSLVHLLQDAISELQVHSPQHARFYPQILFGLGFFIVFFLEKVAFSAYTHEPPGTGNNGSDVHFVVLDVDSPTRHGERIPLMSPSASAGAPSSGTPLLSPSSASKAYPSDSWQVVELSPSSSARAVAIRRQVTSYQSFSRQHSPFLTPPSEPSGYEDLSRHTEDSKRSSLPSLLPSSSSSSSSSPSSAVLPPSMPLTVNSDFWITMLLFLVLSVHSVIEGMALGVQWSIAGTIDIAVAITAHKWVESFALGVSMVREEMPLRRMVVLALSYALMTPLGGVLGMLLLSSLTDGAGGVFTAIVTAIAGGTFMYVAVIDILLSEFACSIVSGPIKAAATSFGFGMMVLMGALFHHQ